jgi:ribosomal protein L12E/L44/L45/RPP1/RPP2
MMAKLRTQDKNDLRVVSGAHIFTITPDGVDVPEFLVSAAIEAGARPVGAAKPATKTAAKQPAKKDES